ncbi:hypothetical protein MUP06_01720 [Patescibacteria group bacterium]|nr:hypothetical protein [Patescibacteria group bacterium]
MPGSEILTLFTFNVIKVLLLSALAAAIGLVLAPVLIRFLNKVKFWKKEARSKTITGETADIFYSLHKEKETAVPRGGGLLIGFLLLFLFFYSLPCLLLTVPGGWRNLIFYHERKPGCRF